MFFQVFRGEKIPTWLAICLLVALGAVVLWPALTTPFFLDDFLHSAMVHGRFPGGRSPLTLYDFIADDNREALFERGFPPLVGPTPRLTLRFLRPLSSLCLYCAHRWLGAWPLLMHLQSFAWSVAAVFAARALFRYCLAPRVAAFATFIFALAPAHQLPLGSLANSEALIAATFGTLGLTAMLRWKDGGGVEWAVWSVVAFCLAMAAGEYGIASARTSWRSSRGAEGAPRRWRSILLFALPTAAAYLVLRTRSGTERSRRGSIRRPAA